MTIKLSGDSAEPAPTTTMGWVIMSLREFGKSITLVLLFTVVITLAGRRIYHDMLLSNQVIQDIARDRVKHDAEFTKAIEEMTRQLQITNAILHERARQN
jgi:hypothetical protein